MTLQPPLDQIAMVAHLNDLARSRRAKATIVMTAGVQNLIEQQASNPDEDPMWTRIRHQGNLLHELAAAPIDPANDPHGEHDFGILDYLGSKLYWKIDCYAADGTMQWGSEAPWDPAQTVRVITLMLPNEY